MPCTDLLSNAIPFNGFSSNVLPPNAFSSNDPLLGEKTSDPSNGHEGIPTQVQAEAPSVYYLYRPDMEQGLPKRKDSPPSGVDNNLSCTVKSSTAHEAEENRTKNKSEDRTEKTEN